MNYYAVITTLVIALTLCMTEAASVSLPQGNRPVKLDKSDVSVPICYMKTADGILDLSSFCEESVAPSLSSVRPSPSPYNAAAIKKFDDELYGEGN